jgi:DNA modification methylase
VITPVYADADVVLFHADCRDVLPLLADESVDAIVTDPPYDLTVGKKGGGFMGQQWDATGVAFDPATWRECLRVLKPGGYLAAFGGTRTYHRMACAIEDAGFEVRDSLHWIYGSGFCCLAEEYGREQGHRQGRWGGTQDCRSADRREGIVPHWGRCLEHERARCD